MQVIDYISLSVCLIESISDHQAFLGKNCSFSSHAAQQIKNLRIDFCCKAYCHANSTIDTAPTQKHLIGKINMTISNDKKSPY